MTDEKARDRGERKSVTFRIWADIDRQIEDKAHEGDTTKGVVFLTALRAIGISVPDEDMQDQRGRPRGKGTS